MQGIYFISQKSYENEEEGCKVFVISRKCDIQMSDMICLLLALFTVDVKIFHPHTDLDLNC